MVYCAWIGPGGRFLPNGGFSPYADCLIEFNQIAIATADGTGSENMLNRVMTKDNIAISALLQTKDGAFDPANMPDPSNARQSIMVKIWVGRVVRITY